MKRIATFTALIALAAGAGFAQTANFIPGEDFMLQWDLDGNGQVTLAEAREQRENIFYMFDQDDDGQFSQEEYAGIDEHKALEREAGKGPGHNLPEGMTPGQGQGRAMGQGKGMGFGKAQGMGQGRAQMGMSEFDMPAAEEMRMFDGNGDGTVTKAEFIDSSDLWFQMRDRNGDGALTTADFGPGR